jgi:predicted nicotinamide N-methyase
VKTDAERIAFVEAHAQVDRAPLLPELRLRLATESTALWQVTEAWLHQRDVPPPFWAFPWAGGQALARHVLDHPELVRGRAVVDFACGGGLVGIAAALAGAERVLAIDLDPLALTATSLNAELNGVRLELDGRDHVGPLLRGFDVLLAGDVFYERAPADRFVRWFRRLVRSGMEVYVGDPERHYLPAGLELVESYEVPTSAELEGRELKRGTVYRVPAYALRSRARG